MRGRETGALSAVFGTIVTGTLSDYVGREASAILACGVSILVVVCALFIRGPQAQLLLWLHACFFGLTWGAGGPAITAKTADLFPGRQLGASLFYLAGRARLWALAPAVGAKSRQGLMQVNPAAPPPM